MDTLQGRIALVTGASRGIGTFIAKTLATRGATVVAVARDRDGLAQTCASIEQAGGRALAVDADLADVAGLGAVIARAEAAAGPIDVLVNNAGVEWYRRYVEYSAEQLRAVLTVNLHTPMELTRQLLPKMLERGRGHIVNIASLAGKKGVLYNAPYSASKAGLILWTDAVRQELAGGPVGISVIMPGYIREAGMFHDDGVPPPKLLGTSSPQDVADAVVRAIEDNRPEIIVNPGPMRPMLALGQLMPRLADRVVEWMGVNAMNEARRRQEE
jgi:short-subunit dehydrogenase